MNLKTIHTTQNGNSFSRGASNCSFTRAIGTIGNKWKPIILHVIGTRTIRFGQSDSIVPLISRKVLAEQLKELEEDGILERSAYKELPPRVEYKFSEKGLAFCQF